MIDVNGVLKPDVGYRWISNGTIWAEIVYIANEESAKNWYDTNEEPPMPPEPENITDSEALEIITGGTI